jgi:hypothetical protein
MPDLPAFRLDRAAVPHGTVPVDARQDDGALAPVAAERRQPPQADPSLAPRRAGPADGGLRPRAALSDLRRRRPAEPASQGEAPPAPAQAPASLIGRAGAVARLAGGYAVAGAYGFSKLWIGAVAISAGYRAVRNPTDYLFHPIATTLGVATFSPRTTPETLDLARAQVQAHYGHHIPADSLCHGVRPEISWDLGDIMGSYGGMASDSWMQPKQLKVAAYTSMVHPQHVANHEFIHCYTHPSLRRAIAGSPDATQVIEGLTEHLADQLPGHRAGKLSMYDLQRLPDGKTWTQAAVQLEQAVGREVLHAAVFAGAPDAVYAVSQAMLQIWAKVPDPDVWVAASTAPDHVRRPMAEAVIGASLLYADKLPEPVFGHEPGRVLPIQRFADITPTDAARLREQAQQARDRIGPRFDLAFCKAAVTQQRRARMEIQSELARHWKPVLQGRA